MINTGSLHFENSDHEREERILQQVRELFEQHAGNLEEVRVQIARALQAANAKIRRCVAKQEELYALLSKVQTEASRGRN
ncbi:hypothetical protein C8T65DRAFT_738471 [Cerioporus squamosus]|nr:hypothetical protein C8T65DRAFT_738471 [Cerioporus squamosus]